MTQSEYTYAIKNITGKNYVLIRDKNQGAMSVTNDIENVIEEICSKRGLVPNETIFLYQDSEGVWDGFDYTNQRFIHIGENTAEKAIEKFNDIQRKNRD